MVHCVVFVAFRYSHMESRCKSTNIFRRRMGVSRIAEPSVPDCENSMSRKREKRRRFLSRNGKPEVQHGQSVLQKRMGERS